MDMFWIYNILNTIHDTYSYVSAIFPSVIGTFVSAGIIFLVGLGLKRIAF